MKLLKQKYMDDKKEYIKPTLIISEFSVQDIIRASTPVPCPGADEPCDADFTNLDDKILNGDFK